MQDSSGHQILPELFAIQKVSGGWQIMGHHLGYLLILKPPTPASPATHLCQEEKQTKMSGISFLPI